MPNPARLPLCLSLITAPDVIVPANVIPVCRNLLGLVESTDALACIDLMIDKDRDKDTIAN